MSSCKKHKERSRRSHRNLSQQASALKVAAIKKQDANRNKKITALRIGNLFRRAENET